MIEIVVNGDKLVVDTDPDTPLLWVLRDYLGLTGAKYSCGIGECGACTVHVDGEPTLSCVLPVKAVAGRSITTIEGLEGTVGRALKEAWVEKDAPQCGYCQPGQIMTAAALLEETSEPTDRDIDEAMSGVLCRCCAYGEIRKAIHHAAKEVQRGKG